MSGDSSRQGDYTREFAGELERKTGLPVEFRDERWTSKEAERTLRGSGVANGRRKATTIDRVFRRDPAAELSGFAAIGAPGGMKKFAAFIVLVLVLGGVCLYVANELAQPYQGFSEPVTIEFPRGTSTSQMAGMLADKGVIEHPWLFLAARLVRRGARLQAGEYQFTKAASPLDIYGRIARGDIFYMELLVPEGYNMFDVADAVAKLGTVSADDYLTAARDPSLIHDLDPHAQTLEGYLFPSKYRVYRKTTAREICRMMTNEFRSQWQLLAASGSPTRDEVHDTVTVASLRGARGALACRKNVLLRVASVFANRFAHRHEMTVMRDSTTRLRKALMEGRLPVA